MKIILLSAVSIAAAIAILLATGLMGSEPEGSHTAAAHSRPSTQIVLQWSDADVGLWRLWLLEDRLERLAGGLYEVDGHDIGSGTANVFLYASDPDGAVSRVIALYEQGRLQPGMRIGVAEYNADRTDWTYRAAFPPGLQAFDPFGGGLRSGER